MRKRLVTEYQQLIADQRKMLDLADREKRSMTTDESASYDTMTARLGEITKEIERIDTHERAAAALTETEGDRGTRPDPSRRDDETETDIAADPLFDTSLTFANRGQREYRSAFVRFLRGDCLAGEVHKHGASLLRALGTGSVGAGSALVPKWIYTDVVKALQQMVRMRQLATVRTSNTNMDIPIMTPPTAAWLGESDDYTDTDPTFANATLNARKLTCLVKIPEELLADAAIDVEGEVLQSFQIAVAQAEEKAFLVGTGSGDDQPTGVLAGSTAGKTAAGTAAVTADEILDLYHSLAEAYRARAVFFMNDATAAAIRKLKGSDGQYIWQRGFGENPMAIEGRPVYTNSNLPTMAASAKSIMFGDFSYYRIQDRPGIFVQRLNELFAGKGQVGFRLYKRTDGVLTLGAAVKHLVQAAS